MNGKKSCSSELDWHKTKDGYYCYVAHDLLSPGFDPENQAQIDSGSIDIL